MRNKIITHAWSASAAAVALPLALTLVCVAAPGLAPAFAQTGGSTGGGAGSTSGTGTSSGADSGMSGGAPGGTVATPPSSGPQARSPATPPSPIPPRDTGGVPPVPSAGNAERSSPIYRQDTPPGALTPQRDAITPGPGLPDADPSRTDTPLGSGGSAASDNPATIEDSLTPTDPSGSPADYGSGRPANSIGDEPNRVTRGAGAAGRDLDECMKLWDKSTHMTRERWRTTCIRLGR
ncbi:hypothetical protein [Hyphomicrobium sp. CS1GBMeth3]|uniref:hypothetical protein n=1 Tax=Hyphomicrobium sp. CS1GBMeth3 TaxID=1892845 RepID=UPI0009309E24|nr:hypothetical protein [Hyphomicrobium sp. CS1GBMeth3]